MGGDEGEEVNDLVAVGNVDASLAPSSLPSRSSCVRGGVRLFVSVLVDPSGKGREWASRWLPTWRW